MPKRKRKYSKKNNKKVCKKTNKSKIKNKKHKVSTSTKKEKLKSEKLINEDINNKNDIDNISNNSNEIVDNLTKIDLKLISEDLVNMYNAYELYKTDNTESSNSSDDELLISDNKIISNKNLARIEKTDNKINNIESKNNIDNIEKESKIQDDFDKILNPTNIKDCYDFIFYKSRKFILDKNNINYQKKNKGYKYRLYKCEFWRKNEAHYQNVKKINHKNKNLLSDDSINSLSYLIDYIYH